MLCSGRGRSTDDDRRAPDAIREHNALIAADDRFISTILPIRDGVMVALRIA